MHTDTLEKIIAKWPEGTVLCLYHRNGFSTIVADRDRIELDRHAVVGTDATGVSFAVPLEEIVYAVVRADRKHK